MPHHASCKINTHSQCLRCRQAASLHFHINTSAVQPNSNKLSCLRADYSDLPPLSAMTNGPRDGAADGAEAEDEEEAAAEEEEQEEEENGYDYPKPRLPPARRTLSEMGASSSNSSSAYSRFSLDSDGRAAARECRRPPPPDALAFPLTNHPANVAGLSFVCLFLKWVSSICCRLFG